MRNALLDLPFDYGQLIESDNYITYTSLSLYPPDGGFLKLHRDSHSGSHTREPILHFKVELSYPDTTFDSGGFVLHTPNSTQINLSKLLSPSDILLFDGSLPHEIEPVYAANYGRYGLFEIPTYVDNESRTWQYKTEDQKVSFFSKVKNKLYN